MFKTPDPAPSHLFTFLDNGLPNSAMVLVTSLCLKVQLQGMSLLINVHIWHWIAANGSSASTSGGSGGTISTNNGNGFSSSTSTSGNGIAFAGPGGGAAHLHACAPASCHVLCVQANMQVSQCSQLVPCSSEMCLACLSPMHGLHMTSTSGH